MNKGNNQNFQYNSCISKGICSISPRISALQNVLLLYLHISAKYCLALLKRNELDENTKNTIITTLITATTNVEFSESSIESTLLDLKKLIPEIIDKYNNLYSKEDRLKNELFEKCNTLTETIRLGEQISRSLIDNLTAEIRDLYRVMLIVAKNICVNILDLESFGHKTDIGFKVVLKILKSLSSEIQAADFLKELIKKAVSCDIELMEALNGEQETNYGEQTISVVSYTTTPSKAVLVVGSNIKELENILEALKNNDIDIYTHDDMMIAHTFPKFKEYNNLKGQYGHGVENCLIDFATFPGPIILTKHSLHNIENFYRGRLFTTDKNFYKGVIKIVDKDFSEVIESANNAKGFKRGKICETVTIGYDYQETTKKISEELETGKYNSIVIIGLKEFSEEQNIYFKKLLKDIPEQTLIISFSYNSESKNLIHINACFDSYAVVKIFNYIKQYEINTNIFMPKCNKNTFSEIIYFSSYDFVKVFIGNCETMLINPSLKKTLKDVFNIKEMSKPKIDINYIKES